MMNFRKYPNITEIGIPNGINLVNTSFYNAFNNMRNLVTSEFNHPNVTSMANTYYNCYNLTSSPVCGNNVIDMSRAYYNCYNLTGNPVCGNNVQLM